VGHSTTNAGTCQPCVGLVAGTYYTANTAYNSSCPTTSCIDDCAVGQYKKDCNGTSMGACAPCTTANASQVYVTSGSWSNTCQVAGCVKTCPSGQYVSGCGALGATVSTLVCGSCTNNIPNINYYVGQGAYTSISCPISVCRTCDNGNYLIGCGGTNPGGCTACNNV
jgi:hypothetical protein